MSMNGVKYQFCGTGRVVLRLQVERTDQPISVQFQLIHYPIAGIRNF